MMDGWWKIMREVGDGDMERWKDVVRWGEMGGLMGMENGYMHGGHEIWVWGGGQWVWGCGHGDRYNGIWGMEGNGRGVCKGLCGHCMVMQRWGEWVQWWNEWKVVNE